MIRSTLLSACLCALWAATGSPARAADLYFRSGGLPTEPFSLERGEEVPELLLDRLAEMALRNRSMAKEFACTEKIYRDDDLARVFDYLLATSTEADVEAIRFKGRRKAGFSDSFPPPFVWGLLFSYATQPYFVFRYQGESLYGPDLTYKIAFRGSHAFEKGTALPEWEGILILDARSLELIRVEAAPRIYADLLPVKRQRYLRSFKIGFFGYPIRFRRAPRVHVLTVDFEDVVVGGDRPESSETEALVARLPKNMQWLEYKIGLHGDLVHKRTEERRYSRYRFFDATARDLEYGKRVGD